MTTTTLRPVQWTLDRPDVCACAGAYRPQLTDKGKLVKAREPAWQMKESVRSNDCLQAFARGLAAHYAVGYQHSGDSRKSDRGYPDVHLWPRGGPPGRGSTYVELKQMDPNPSEDQVRVMGELAAAGHPVFLVRPCCLLTGVFDQIVADVAGVRPQGKYADPRQRPDATPAATSLLPTAPELAAPARPAPAPRRPRPQPELPGVEPPEEIPRAVGYVVPSRAILSDYPAMVELESWLRAAGFPPTLVPFPMRIVAGDALVVVQVRVTTERVWRAAPTTTPFPRHLVSRLAADVHLGPGRYLMTLIEHAVPNVDLPAQPPEPTVNRSAP